LEHITGYVNGDPISEDEVMQLIKEAKVNVMIYHTQAGNPAGEHICFIDDKRFQQR
jgi:hypothetical protein